MTRHLLDLGIPSSSYLGVLVRSSLVVSTVGRVEQSRWTRLESNYIGRPVGIELRRTGRGHTLLNS